MARRVILLLITIVALSENLLAAPEPFWKEGVTRYAQQEFGDCLVAIENCVQNLPAQVPPPSSAPVIHPSYPFPDEFWDSPVCMIATQDTCYESYQEYIDRLRELQSQWNEFHCGVFLLPQCVIKFDCSDPGTVDVKFCIIW